MSIISSCNARALAPRVLTTRRQSVRAPVRVVAYVEDKEITPPKTAGNGGKVGGPDGRCPGGGGGGRWRSASVTLHTPT